MTRVPRPERVSQIPFSPKLAIPCRLLSPVNPRSSMARMPRPVPVPQILSSPIASQVKEVVEWDDSVDSDSNAEAW